MICFAIGTFIALAVFSKVGAKFGKDGAIGAKLMVLAMVAGAGYRHRLEDLPRPDAVHKVVENGSEVLPGWRLPCDPWFCG